MVKVALVLEVEETGREDGDEGGGERGGGWENSEFAGWCRIRLVLLALLKTTRCSGVALRLPPIFQTGERFQRTMIKEMNVRLVKSKMKVVVK